MKTSRIGVALLLATLVLVVSVMSDWFSPPLAGRRGAITLSDALGNTFSASCDSLNNVIADPFSPSTTSSCGSSSIDDDSTTSMSSKSRSGISSSSSSGSTSSDSLLSRFLSAFSNVVFPKFVLRVEAVSVETLVNKRAQALLEQRAKMDPVVLVNKCPPGCWPIKPSPAATADHDVANHDTAASATKLSVAASKADNGHAGSSKVDIRNNLSDDLKSREHEGTNHEDSSESMPSHKYRHADDAQAEVLAKSQQQQQPTSPSFLEYDNQGSAKHAAVSALSLQPGTAASLSPVVDPVNQDHESLQASNDDSSACPPGCFAAVYF